MNKMKRLAGKKILLVAVALCAFGFAKAQDTQAEHRSMYSYVRLSIDRCTATYV